MSSWVNFCFAEYQISVNIFVFFSKQCSFRLGEICRFTAEPDQVSLLNYFCSLPEWIMRPKRTVVVVVVVEGILSFSSFTFTHRILQAAPVNLNVLKEKMTTGKQLKKPLQQVTSKGFCKCQKVTHADSQHSGSVLLLSLKRGSLPAGFFCFPAPVPRPDSPHDDYLFPGK